MTVTKTLGLVGGLGLEAGIYYYKHLAEALAERGLPLAMLLVHADVRTAMGYVAAGEIEQLAEYLSGLIRQLAAGGAALAAVPAVTPHIAIAQISKSSPIPLVSILQTVAAAVEQRGLRRIALFGTRFVIESDLYGALPASAEAVRPAPSEIERIDRLYRAYAVSNRGGAEERAEFVQIANELCRRERLDAVILAGTDLSALFEGHEIGFPHVDASAVHIAAILQQLRAA